jgi:putative DNA modification/repair radical SAM protein
MAENLMNKLKILADSAKFDVSCSSSGSSGEGKGKVGSTHMAGICHSWSADGRCISLLKILFTNNCVYDCAYCVNRRSAQTERASFEPEELARLTMEFYRRNYIEGLFISSAVEVSPDHTGERILACLDLLRNQYGFAGYIHAKLIPGMSPELIHQIGLRADRLSINIELPTEEGLKRLAPQKQLQNILKPMNQITTTMMEQKTLKAPGHMHPLMDPSAGRTTALDLSGSQRRFAPAGQTTQMIIGATGETDQQIIHTSEKLYHRFVMKRVYYSAYIPVSSSSLLPSALTAPPLMREHRLYQADWLLRFYGFTAEEILPSEHPDLELEMDPKAAWALRHLERFPIEVNKASLEDLLRIPGVGEVSARRILRQRRVASVKAEDLKRMGVVMKRAKYFLTCQGKYYGGKDLVENTIRGQILMEERLRYRLTGGQDQQQLSLFSGPGNWIPESHETGREGRAWPSIAMTEPSKGS